jgi:hypothetical protein
MSVSYLDVVNKVLKRLRESTVTTVTETDYSSLIGDLVNDVKVEIENSWDWSALRTTLTIDTSASIFSYEFTDSNVRMRVLNAYNDTDDFLMTQKPGSWFDQQFMDYDAAVEGSPMYYNFNGTSADGTIAVDVFPIPDGVYTLHFNVALPMTELTADADIVYLPSDLLVAGVVSRAMEERGVDGGNQNAELRYKMLLADYIAIDASKREDETTWSAS